MLTFDYDTNELQLNIDEESKTAKWEMKDPTDQLWFVDAIYFGGSNDEGANGIGLFGCISEPYVGHIAALTHYQSAENSKVLFTVILNAENF